MIVDITTSYCIKPDSAAIEGFYGFEKYTSIVLDMKRCSNTTENNFHCHSNEEIENKLDDGAFSILAFSYFPQIIKTILL